MNGQAGYQSRLFTDIVGDFSCGRCIWHSESWHRYLRDGYYEARPHYEGREILQNSDGIKADYIIRTVIDPSCVRIIYLSIANDESQSEKY